MPRAALLSGGPRWLVAIDRRPRVGRAGVALSAWRFLVCTADPTNCMVTQAWPWHPRASSARCRDGRVRVATLPHDAALGILHCTSAIRAGATFQGR